MTKDGRAALLDPDISAQNWQFETHTQDRGGFYSNGDTGHPARAQEERTETGHDAITQPQARRTLPGAIEAQELLLEEHRLGHDGTHAAAIRHAHVDAGSS